jgi:hypothetical protein
MLTYTEYSKLAQSEREPIVTIAQVGNTDSVAIYTQNNKYTVNETQQDISFSTDVSRTYVKTIMNGNIKNSEAVLIDNTENTIRYNVFETPLTTFEFIDSVTGNTPQDVPIKSIGTPFNYEWQTQLSGTMYRIGFVDSENLTGATNVRYEITNERTGKTAVVTGISNGGAVYEFDTNNAPQDVFGDKLTVTRKIENNQDQTLIGAGDTDLSIAVGEGLFTESAPNYKSFQTKQFIK